ncbi:MAG: DNA polymerase IV [Magnetococcales bacterium]|nr:DNA polymerase IV [Magnetococcales bacterium]MBF0148753.1 DNA polymerase IV [Magnetococcales bacterium]MBF0173776.1 DNA polymerase IV [Magnetococcales bacterium]MBF0348559.1 DNA polymerase IV [Magnetococcales bacterium]MBF0630304.1 DNA polymerase IV [Magnetococcales bacterium]
MNAPRKIIHIDMDAFFASVEQRDNPEFRGRPLVVGGNSERGVVAAASYEARRFGIRSAMAMRKALTKCPGLVVVPPRMNIYHAVSLEIREIFLEYTDLVEPLSLDEAFLDVTRNKKGMASASLIAQEIRARIYERTGLTASAGVSINKFLAKVASDINKPNGLTLVAPEQADAFVATLPIEKFYGVGKVTADRMHRLGIKTGADLRRWPLDQLEAQFGKAGRGYYHIVRNQDARPVNPNRERHSVGTEDTFERDLHDRREMLIRLEAIAHEVARRMAKNHFTGKTLTLKVKFADFRQITRSKTVDDAIVDPVRMMILTRRLFAGVQIPPRGVRLLGLTVSNTCSEQVRGWKQWVLPLFDGPDMQADPIETPVG